MEKITELSDSLSDPLKISSSSIHSDTHYRFAHVAPIYDVVGSYFSTVLSYWFFLVTTTKEVTPSVQWSPSKVTSTYHHITTNGTLHGGLRERWEQLAWEQLNIPIFWACLISLKLIEFRSKVICTCCWSRDVHSATSKHWPLEGLYARRCPKSLIISFWDKSRLGQHLDWVST